MDGSGRTAANAPTDCFVLRDINFRPMQGRRRKETAVGSAVNGSPPSTTGKTGVSKSTGAKAAGSKTGPTKTGGAAKAAGLGKNASQAKAAAAKNVSSRSVTGKTAPAKNASAKAAVSKNGTVRSSVSKSGGRSATVEPGDSSSAVVSASTTNGAPSGATGTKNAEQPRSDDVVLRATIPPDWTSKVYKPVRLSVFDKSPMLISMDEGNMIKGHKGYRSARATAGVCEGDWYFEVEVLDFEGNGAVRPGWTTRRSDVETPAGFDVYGFSVRDRTGEFVHCARRKAYGPSFTKGDVIGCRIILPTLTDEEKESVAAADRAWLEFRFVNFLQGQTPADSGIDITSRSKVLFYKNGVCMGTPLMFQEKAGGSDKKGGQNCSQDGGHGSRARNADGKSSGGSKKGKGKDNKASAASSPGSWNEMRAGVYYPTLSLFGNAVMKSNFGPNFKFPAPPESKPMCDAAPDKPVEPVRPPMPKVSTDAKAGDSSSQGVETSVDTLVGVTGVNADVNAEGSNGQIPNGGVDPESSGAISAAGKDVDLMEGVTVSRAGSTAVPSRADDISPDVLAATTAAAEGQAYDRM